MVVYACVINCFGHVWLFAALWTVALQTPLSMGFSRQEYWKGCHALLQEIFLTQELNPSQPFQQPCRFDWSIRTKVFFFVSLSLTICCGFLGFPGGTDNEECNTGNLVQSLGWEDPLEEATATPSSILAWRIPWTEESGGLQNIGSQSVRHNWVTKHSVTSCQTKSSSSFTLWQCISSVFWAPWFLLWWHFMMWGLF